MLYFHPVFMTIVILVSLYVLWLGGLRVRMNHFGHSVQFDWRRHVVLGQAVLVCFALGIAGGMTMAWYHIGSIGTTGWHFLNALWYMLPLFVIGYATGRMMDRQKRRRILLHAVHGFCMAIFITLAVCQFSTGVLILSKLAD